MPWPRDRPPDIDSMVMTRRWYGMSEQAAIAAVARELGLETSGRPWTIAQLKALVGLREQERRRPIGDETS